MSFRSQFDSFKSPGSRPAARRQDRKPVRRRAAAARMRLEALEDRCLLSFNPVVNYSVGSSPNAAVAADFNNDARVDLAVANWGDSTVSVLLGNAGGTFQPAVTSATGIYPISLAVGDFDADGKKDLATANTFSGVVSVLLGHGDGTFQPPANIDTGINPQSVAVGDFNADGKLDLVALSYSVDYYGSYSFADVMLGTGTG